MVDFRSKHERQADQKRQQSTAADYKQMYEAVLAENRELNGKFSSLEGRFGDVVAEFQALQNRFAETERHASERAAELLRMSEAMQEMVASGYDQQTDLMERFRADISQRLAKAESTTLSIKDHGNG